MPRFCLPVFRRTVALCLGAAFTAHAAPTVAQQSAGNSYAPRPAGIAANVLDFPASTGRFRSERGIRSGPADLAASLPQRPGWRMCGECGYRTALPRPFHSFAIHANFQPIGGTVSYRF